MTIEDRYQSLGIPYPDPKTWTMEKLREKWLEFGCGDDVADFLDELEGEG